MTYELSGTCGTYTIRCAKIKQSNFLLEIAPIDPERGGVLDKWNECPPWYHFGLGSCVTKAKILPGVKALTCTKMFFDFQNLKESDLSELDVSNVTDMSYMFYGCLNLTSFDVSGWSDSQLKSIDRMFGGRPKGRVLVKIRSRGGKKWPKHFQIGDRK